MCPLCEVDQLSAADDLYEDSDPEELQHILFDDTLNTTETDTEVCLFSSYEQKNIFFYYYYSAC
jgi:hypothetical protein